MRIIFLDVDGVLNCKYTKEKRRGFGGIDDNLVKNLKTLVDKSNEIEETNIVISSSWRIGQERNIIDEIPSDYAYLTDKLHSQGLIIYDDTPKFKWTWKFYTPRGREITAWLYQNRTKDIHGYVVLDDECFEDFEKYKIVERLVQTSWDVENGGFQEKYIDKALLVLNIPYNFYENTHK